MIELTQAEGIKDRILKGVKFTDGKAYLPDELLPKAKSICKYHNVRMNMVGDDEVKEDITSDINPDPDPNNVGPESVGSDESSDEDTPDENSSDATDNDEE